MKKYFPANVSFCCFFFCQQDGGKFYPFLVLTFLIFRLVSLLLQGKFLSPFFNFSFRQCGPPPDISDAFLDSLGSFSHPHCQVPFFVNLGWSWIHVPPFDFCLAWLPGFSRVLLPVKFVFIWIKYSLLFHSLLSFRQFRDVGLLIWFGRSKFCFFCFLFIFQLSFLVSLQSLEYLGIL